MLIKQQTLSVWVCVCMMRVQHKIFLLRFHTLCLQLFLFSPHHQPILNRKLMPAFNPVCRYEAFIRFGKCMIFDWIFMTIACFVIDLASERERNQKHFITKHMSLQKKQECDRKTKCTHVPCIFCYVKRNVNLVRKILSIRFSFYFYFKNLAACHKFTMPYYLLQ